MARVAYHMGVETETVSSHVSLPITQRQNRLEMQIYQLSCHVHGLCCINPELAMFGC